MERIEKTIECDVPCAVAYNQWTQFESFPSFMEGVEQVEQIDDKRLHWVAEIAGRRKEWDAEIVEQVPDQVISWRSIAGPVNNGSVTFQAIDEGHCKITCIITYEPEGGVEKVGDALGIVSARIQGDLNRFKEFIEARQVETGAWRGKIREGEVKEKAASSTTSTTDYGKTESPSTGYADKGRGF